MCIRDRYNHSVTTVQYNFNAKGQLIGAIGRTVGVSTQRVATSTRVQAGTDASGDPIYQWRVTGDTNNNGIEEGTEVWGVEQQTSASTTINTYAVVMGQAQVVKSVTTTDAVGSNGAPIAAGAHGYNHSVTTVQYNFNAKGQLIGAIGRTVGVSTQRVATSTLSLIHI